MALRSGGRARSYLLVPDGGPDAPLVVLLHGTNATAAGELARTGFGPLAASEHLDVAAGTSVGDTWNSGSGCCSIAAATHVDDVAYVDAVVRDALARTGADPARVYLVGYSNGGKLAYGVACSLGSGLAGLATYGAGPQRPCRQHVPVSLFQGYGSDDPLEPPAGEPGHARGVHPSARSTIAAFLARDGCEPVSELTLHGPARMTAWKHCTDGTTVEAVRWTGQTHAWPQPDTMPAADDGSSLIWDFFSSLQPRTGLSAS